MKRKLKQTKGITLIALVITIIVLLILAGVSIAMLTGENGILTQANKSKIEQSHGEIKEALSLAYNEYQIEINTASTTKVASREIVTIKGEEEKAKSGITETFLQFLEDKGYVRDGTTDVLNVETLTGSKQALGNGTNTDIYKIEEENGKYIVNYYDEKGATQEIWSISNTTNTVTGDLTLEPDTGKEALILVYNVSAGDEIELPYGLNYYNNEGRQNAKFDFTVDWGDGNTDAITNTDITDKMRHQYTTAGEKKITINGTFESLCGIYYDYENRENIYHKGIDKIARVEQWGLTELKEISLDYCTSLTQIAAPTKNSFKNLTEFSYTFDNTAITSIPENLFANCPNVTDFSSTFANTAITSIPENLFANCPNVTDFSSTFANTAITSIPENLFANCPNVTDFGSTFADTAITSIPEDLFEKCPNVRYFESTFAGCDNLTGNAPDLWLRVENGEENGYIGTPYRIWLFL